MMKRSFFEAVGRWGDEIGRTLSEDLEFLLRCVGRSPIGVVTAPVVGIRKHGGNFSGDALRRQAGEVNILQYVLKTNPYAPLYKRQIEEQIAIRSAGAASLAFSGGDMASVRRFLQAVPPGRRSWKLHCKGLIAGCPAGLGQIFQRITTVAAGRRLT
jgi:hypothetical protein